MPFISHRSMIKPYPRFSIYSSAIHFPLRFISHIKPWLFSRLFQFSFFTFSCGSQDGHPPSRQPAVRKGSHWGKGQEAEELGLSGPDFCLMAEKRWFRGACKTGRGDIAVPAMLTLLGSSSCKAPSCCVLDSGYNKLIFGAGTMLVVRPCEYDHANDQGRSNWWLSMRKRALIYGKVRVVWNTCFPFLQALGDLKRSHFSY